MNYKQRARSEWQDDLCDCRVKGQTRRMIYSKRYLANRLLKYSNRLFTTIYSEILPLAEDLRYLDPYASYLQEFILKSVLAWEKAISPAFRVDSRFRSCKESLLAIYVVLTNYEEFAY